MVPSQSREFAKAVDTLRRPVRHLVLTHAHIEHCGGTGAFPMAAIYGSQVTSDALDLPPSISAYRTFMPEYSRELANFGDHPPRTVSRIVYGPTRLAPRVALLPASGHTTGDLIAVVDGDAVAFAGGLVNNGVAPLGFQSFFDTWADTADVVGDLAEVIIPAEGASSDASIARIMAEYLRACVAAQGQVERMPSGAWDLWAEREFRDRVNVERAHLLASGIDAISPTMLKALGVA